MYIRNQSQCQSEQKETKQKQKNRKLLCRGYIILCILDKLLHVCAVSYTAVYYIIQLVHIYMYQMYVLYRLSSLNELHADVFFFVFHFFSMTMKLHVIRACSIADQYHESLAAVNTYIMDGSKHLSPSQNGMLPYLVYCYYMGCWGKNYRLQETTYCSLEDIDTNSTHVYILSE